MPMQLGAPASPHRQPSLLCTALPASIEQPVRDAEIPIALAAPTCLTTRGFLPWRLSDAGPGACLTVAMGRHPKPFTQLTVRWAAVWQESIESGRKGRWHPLGQVGNSALGAARHGPLGPSATSPSGELEASAGGNT